MRRDLSIYRAGLTASGICPVSARLGSQDEANRLVARRKYHEQATRIRRQNGGLDFWHTGGPDKAWLG